MKDQAKEQGAAPSVAERLRALARSGTAPTRVAQELHEIADSLRDDPLGTVFPDQQAAQREANERLNRALDAAKQCPDASPLRTETFSRLLTLSPVSGLDPVYHYRRAVYDSEDLKFTVNASNLEYVIPEFERALRMLWEIREALR
jgi:hypothetical protein